LFHQPFEIFPSTAQVQDGSIRMGVTSYPVTRHDAGK
jgi:hypothetical protein